MAIIHSEPVSFQILIRFRNYSRHPAAALSASSQKLTLQVQPLIPASSLKRGGWNPHVSQFSVLQEDKDR